MKNKKRYITTVLFGLTFLFNSCGRHCAKFIVSDDYEGVVVVKIINNRRIVNENEFKNLYKGCGLIYGDFNDYNYEDDIQFYFNSDSEIIKIKNILSESEIDSTNLYYIPGLSLTQEEKLQDGNKVFVSYFVFRIGSVKYLNRQFTEDDLPEINRMTKVCDSLK